MFRKYVDNPLVVTLILSYLYPEETPDLRLIFKTLDADLESLAEMNCFIPAVKTSCVAREMLLSRGVLSLKMPKFKSSALLFDGVIGEEVNAGYWERSMIIRLRWTIPSRAYAYSLASCRDDKVVPLRVLKVSDVINSVYHHNTDYLLAKSMAKNVEGKIEGVPIIAAHHFIALTSRGKTDEALLDMIVKSYTRDEWYSFMDIVDQRVLNIYPPTNDHRIRRTRWMIEDGLTSGEIMGSCSERIFAIAISQVEMPDDKFTKILRSFSEHDLKSRYYLNTPRGKEASDYFRTKLFGKLGWGSRRGWQY